MYSEINIELESGEMQSIPMTANAATVIRYKTIFGGDLQKEITASMDTLFDVNKKEEITDQDKVGVYADFDTEPISKLAYVMYMQAEKNIAKASHSHYLTWLEFFSATAFMESAVEIISLYLGQKTSTSNPKKSDAPQIEN